MLTTTFSLALMQWYNNWSLYLTNLQYSAYKTIHSSINPHGQKLIIRSNTSRQLTQTKKTYGCL